MDPEGAPCRSPSLVPAFPTNVQVVECSSFLHHRKSPGHQRSYQKVYIVKDDPGESNV